MECPRWPYIVLAVLVGIILLLVISLIYAWVRIDSMISDINITPDPFQSVQFPSSFTTSTPLAMFQVTVPAIMAMVNRALGQSLVLPGYFTDAVLLPNNYGFVARSPSPFPATVILRGTLFAADYRTDLNYDQVEFYKYGNVHKGFAAVADLLYQPIITQLQTIGVINGPILIGGHSMGASVSELLSVRLAALGYQPTILLSARPNTGDFTWETNVLKMTTRYILVNISDDIPVLPLTTMPGKTTSLFVPYLNNYPNIIVFDYQAGTIGKNHNPRTYQASITPGIAPAYPAIWSSPVEEMYTRCTSSG